MLNILETPKSVVYQLPIHAIRRLLGGTFGRFVAWTDTPPFAPIAASKYQSVANRRRSLS